MSQRPSDDIQFHSVDPEVLKRITLADVEAGNLYGYSTLSDSVPIRIYEQHMTPAMTKQDLFMIEAAAVMAFQQESWLGLDW